MESFEVTVDSDGAVIIPEKALRELKIGQGSKLELSIRDGSIILSRKKGISKDDYERLISKAEAYANEMGIDPGICYAIVEEYLESL